MSRQTDAKILLVDMGTEKTQEWLSRKSEEFDVKADFLVEQGLKEISIDQYFRLLFDRFGYTYLQEFKALPSKLIEPDGWYCGLVRYFQQANETTGEVWQREHARSFIVTREYERTLELVGREKCYTSPLIYIGHKRPGKNARAFFAFVIDVDGVNLSGLKFFFKAVADGRAPKPSIVVSSGSGIHLYFLLNEPLALNAYTSPMLHYLKIALTTKLWGMCSSIANPQYHGIFQGYRVPGTKAKVDYGINRNVLGFIDATDDVPYYTVSMLNEYLLKSRNLSQELPLNSLQLERLESFVFDPTRKKTSLAEAKERWPEWYKKRGKKIDMKAEMIAISDQAASEVQHSRWYVKRDLYDWWLRTLRETARNKVKVGHRYHCILALVVFAEKCGVEFSELKKDALSFYEFMESLTDDPANHFHKKDIKDALLAYRESARLYPRRMLELITAIPMPANKRNYRKQKLHLKIARNTQDIICKNENRDWRTGNGPKDKFHLIQEWKANNPNNDNKSLCARELGITRPTVIKWWNCTVEEYEALKREKEDLKLVGGYKMVADEPSVINDLGAAYNSGYVADSKIAALAMQNTEGYDKQSEETIKETGEKLTDSINYGEISIEAVMRAMGFPEAVIPILMPQIRQAMSSPEFWKQYKAANPTVDTSKWPPELLEALNKVSNK